MPNEILKNQSIGLFESDLERITENSYNDLQAMRNARLFITGGTGYIGRWLLESICHANSQLNLGLNAVVLSRRPDHFAHQFPHLADNSAISLVQGDVRNFHFVKGEFTHLLHAATDVVAPIMPLDLFEVTVSGTKRVLEFARESSIKNILLFSSGAVYGRYPEDIYRVPEGYAGAIDINNSESAYGLGKIVTEWLGNTYAQNYGISCKSARIFAQVGPHLELNAQFAAGNLIRDALQGKPLIIKGDGKSLRSYMYPTDLITWLWAILIRGKSGNSYNVGSDRAVSIRELAEIVSWACHGGSAEIRVLCQAAPGAAPDRYVPEISKGRDQLNLTITVSCEEAIRRTYEWNVPRFAIYPDDK